MIEPNYREIVKLKGSSLLTEVRRSLYQEGIYKPLTRNHGLSLNPFFAALGTSPEDSSFPNRLTRTTAIIIEDFEELTGAVVRTSEYLAPRYLPYTHYSAMVNLALLIPALPVDYARDTLKDSLRSLISNLTRIPSLNKNQEETAAHLLDANNALMKPGDDISLQNNLWKLDKRSYWAPAFVGISISSRDEALNALPLAVIRAQREWKGAGDAFWAFACHHIKDAEVLGVGMAQRLRELDRTTPPTTFTLGHTFFSSFLEQLTKAGVKPDVIQKVHDHYLLTGIGWGDFDTMANPDFQAARQRLDQRVAQDK